MKISRIILAGIILAIITIGAVSAAENTTVDDCINAPEIEDTTLSDGEKQDLNAELEIPNYIVKPNPNDGNPTINVKKIPNDYYGQISAYVDGNHVADSNDGYFEDIVNLRAYDYGKHSVLVMIAESQKYNPKNLTGEFETVEGYIRIDETINSNEGVYAEFKTGATGYLTVNVDGKLFKKVKIEANEYDLSHAFVSLATLSKGTHSVEAIYSGDANNKKIVKKADIEVVYKIPIGIEKPAAYRINGNYANAYGSEFNYIEIRLPNDAKCAPVVTIDGTVFDAVKDYTNTYTVNTSHLKPGEHTVNVTYPGDTKYSMTSAIENFRTIAAIGMHFIEGSEYTYNNTIVYLYLPQDARGNLSVSVDGMPYFTGPGSNKVYLSDVKIGIHTIEASYTGDDYDVKNITKEIDMPPKAIYPRSMQYSANETFRIEANPDVKLNVTVAYGKKSFTLPLEEGKANFSLSELELIEYEDGFYESTEIWMTYQGDYNSSRVYSIRVDPIPSRLVGQSSITMYYGDSKTYSLTVWGNHGKIVSAGETVIVRFGTDYLYPKTDAKGVVKVKISKVPGTYRITATYKDAQVTGKITVKQVLSLKSLTVKKSGKKLTLQATLKNKNPIKNKQVTFKFNGKTYKAKTNSKGVAKVTIKSSVLKKLKVGKKVTYQATYLKDTVKKTVKVKK